ncbi:MAG: zinc-ribbon domain-containing protein [Bacillota bacterium]|nr:MAG: zinc-ribbon domain-containing protein [Bacillota bacterium]
MHEAPESWQQQFWPLVIQTVVGLFILLFSWAVVAFLPMVKEVYLPLEFTLEELLTGVILTVAIILLLSFGGRLERRLNLVGPGQGAAGRIVKFLMVLLSVMIAYVAYRPLAIPYLEGLDLDWVYGVTFLGVCLIALALLGWSVYAYTEYLARAPRGRAVAAAAAGYVVCSRCGRRNEQGWKFCGACGAELFYPSLPVCPNCRTPGHPESRFCSVCGTPLQPAAPAAEQGPAQTAAAAEPAVRACSKCGTMLRDGATFCTTCGTRN